MRLARVVIPLAGANLSRGVWRGPTLPVALAPLLQGSRRRARRGRRRLRMPDPELRTGPRVDAVHRSLDLLALYAASMQGRSIGQRFVSYQVAQASRLSKMRLAHSGERADAQSAAAYSSASSPPSANSLKLSRSSVSSG